MIFDCYNADHKKRMHNAYNKAYIEAVSTVEKLADTDKRISKTRLNRSIQEHFNTLYIQEVPNVDKLGEACLYYNTSPKNSKWYGFECCIKISDHNFKQKNDDLLVNTLIHEIFHIMADTICQCDQGHHGMWKDLADLYNKTHKGMLKVQKTVFLDEIMTKQELREYDLKELNKSLPFKYDLYCPKCGMVYAKTKFYTNDIKNHHNYQCKNCNQDLKTRKI